VVRPRSCRVIYYFDTPALGIWHQSFDRVTYSLGDAWVQTLVGLSQTSLSTNWSLVYNESYTTPFNAFSTFLKIWGIDLQFLFREKKNSVLLFWSPKSESKYRVQIRLGISATQTLFWSLAHISSFKSQRIARPISLERKLDSLQLF